MRRRHGAPPPAPAVPSVSSSPARRSGRRAARPRFPPSPVQRDAPGNGTPKRLEQPRRHLIDELPDRRRLFVERRHRRGDDRAGLGSGDHGPEVAEMKRRLADAEHEPAPLLERDVRGPGDEGVA